MSRYNEDWQRRKAYLIRSLFNDIPVLSPVTEESTLSTNGKDQEKSEQSLPSSEDQIFSEFEPYKPTNTVQNIISPTVNDSARGYRPCSPLPPLIIEREPNRHDEPPQHYVKLLIKIKNIYKKMFLEGKQISDGDFFENNFEQNSVTDKSDLSNGSSFNSNGYTADDESIDSDTNTEHNCSKSIVMDTFFSDRCLRNDIIDKGMESIVNNNTDINIDLPDEEMHLNASDEEPNYSQITTAADVHIDGQPLPEITPSPIYGEQPNEVPSVQDPIPMTQEESDKQLRDSSQRTLFQLFSIPVSANDISERITSELMQQDSLMEQAHEFEESQPHIKNSFEPDQRLEVSQCLISDHRSKSPVLECCKQKQQRKGTIVSSYVLDEVLEDYPEIPQRDKTVEVQQNTPAKMSCSLSSSIRSYPSEGESMMLKDPQEPNYRQITITADVHIDCQPPPEITPSPIYGEQPTKVTSVQDPILMTQEESDKQLRYSNQRTSFQTIPILANDMSEHVTLELECTELLRQQTAVRKDSLMELVQEFVESQPHLRNPFGPDQRLEVSQHLKRDHRSKNPVLECCKQKQQRKGGKDEVLKDYLAATSNRVKVQAEVNTEITQQDKSVKVPQNAPARVSCCLSSGMRSQRSERESTILEDLQDPETTVEVMRTTRQVNASLESIPGGNTRLTSDMDLTCKHNTVLQDISNMTSQSQDGGHVKGTTEPKISVDMDDILTSINNSNHMYRQSTENINAYKPSSSRKRRHETISVQTEGVTWNNLRADFFIGTPKIFRLCSCVDHDCR